MKRLIVRLEHIMNDFNLKKKLPYSVYLLYADTTYHYRQCYPIYCGSIRESGAAACDGK